MPITDIVGKWKFVSSENFDGYLKEAGIGFILRGVANSSKPELEFIINGDEWQFISTSTFKTYKVQFKIGVPSEFATIDGRNAVNTFTIEDDVLVHKEVVNGSISTIKRFLEGGKLKIVMECNGVKATRIYERK